MPEIHPIILNQNNAEDSHTFTYRFSKGAVHLKNASIALSECQIFYSWGNIEPQFNNNVFKIIFPDGTPETFTTYTVTIPFGNYTIEDLNKFLQHWSIQNGKYIVNATTGQNVYYLEFISNPQTYQIEFISYKIPEGGLPAGYLNPGGMTFPVTANAMASLVILNTNNFGNLIGFEPGVYFTSASTKTPQMSPISSILMSCNLINSGFSNPSNILYSFVSGSTEYGHMISVQNQSVEFIKIHDGVYRELSIKFIDDKFRPLYIKDTSLLISLLIKIDDA